MTEFDKALINVMQSLPDEDAENILSVNQAVEYIDNNKYRH